ncbi:MAG: hypothetical protein LBQ84_01575 [Flavobacteriaceae bacterium]|jgi:hypothetical protein|nr:hypothetical protein [Flavobacteriaceae bacterium]
MRYLIGTLIFAQVFFLSCSKKNNIIITKSYIQNEYWKDPEGLSSHSIIQVSKLKVKDTISSVGNYSLEDYVNKNLLEVDTINKEQNCWGMFPKSEGIKIYFTKDYGILSWYCCEFNTMDDKYKKDNIGELKNNTWYLFKSLRPGIYGSKYYVYVYVDEKGETHIFIKNLINV